MVLQMTGKNQRILCSVVMLFIVMMLFPVSSPSAFHLVEGSVFDCIEGQKDCDQNNPSTKSESNTEGNLENEPELITKKGGITWVDSIRTILAFVFVIVLLLWLLKFVNRKNRAYSQNQLMRNMGGISLGQHKSIQLVLIGDTYYLIGVGEDIRLLKEVTDVDEIEKLKTYYENEQEVDSNSYMNRIAEQWQKLKKSSKKETNASTSTEDFQSMLNTRLDELKKERKKQMKRAAEKEQNRDE